MYRGGGANQFADGSLESDGIVEVWSGPCVAKAAQEHELTEGWSLDLLTGWDFRKQRARDFARALIERARPKLLVGSPMCTYFSNLMSWNWHRMDPEEAKRSWRSAAIRLNSAGCSWVQGVPDGP